MVKKQIETILNETRRFAPSVEFTKAAHIKSQSQYDKDYRESIDDPDSYWGRVAGELHWFRKWDDVLDESGAPFYKWFVGGKTNLSYNCLDRHLDSATRNKAALIWEGEPGDRRVLTYADMAREVSMFANALKKLGVTKGDRVAIYLPMIPELAISLLACARIGAIHSVIFAGCSAE